MGWAHDNKNDDRRSRGTGRGGGAPRQTKYELRKARRARARGHTGCRERRSADGGFHERHGAREDEGIRLRHLLQPLAEDALDEGRNIGQQARGPADSRGLRRGYGPREGQAAWRRKVCHTGTRGTCFNKTHSQARPAERIAAGFDRAAVRARRIHDLRQLPLVLSIDRRSGNRVHADSRAGNGALCGRRRARLRADRPGLDCGASKQPRDAGGARAGGRSHLLEAELRQGSLGSRCARGLAVQKACRISRARRSRPSSSARRKRISIGSASTSTSNSRGEPPR